MQVLSRATDNSLVTPQASPQHVRPPGQYYSHLDGAWVVRHKQSDPSRAGSYPSPPMSGSPHSQKAASDASERPPPSNSYPTALPQDVYRTAASSTQPSPTDSQPSQGFPSAYDYHHRPYAPETTQPRDAMAPAQHATARYPPRPLSFPLPAFSDAQRGAAAPPGFRPAPMPLTPTAPGYPTSARATQPGEGHFFTSPRAQRKAKGHVASACVPCKRAHLRCDTQRPCSRCLANGKEDACVDVQHKKRGRPRLRDEREARYDPPRPPAHPEEALRRPVSMYAPGTAHAMGYDVPPLHAQARQHIQPRMSLPPGFLDRPGPSAPPQQEAAPGYRTTWPPAPPGQQGQTPEAAAFLSLDLEFYRASSEFSLMLGGLGGRRFLADVLIPYERDMAARIRSQLLEEQRRRDPNYLPPIMGRGSEIVERIGFTAADIARYQLNLQESLTFVTAGGVMRPYTVRLGLAKEGSFYFVVLVLLAPPPLPPTTPPGHAYYSHQPLIRRRQSVMQRPVSQHGAPPQRPLSQHGFPPQQPPRYAVRDPAPSRLLSEGPPPPTPGPGRLPPSMSAPLHHQPGPPGLGHTGAPAPAPTPAPAPSPQSSTPAPPRQGMMPPMPRPYSAVGGAPPPAPPAFQGPPLPQTPRSELPQPQPQPPPPPTWRLPPIRAPDEANTASTPSSRVDIPGLLHRGADAGPR